MTGEPLNYSNSMGVTGAAQFIPQVWSDDVIATYKRNKVMANLVSNIDHKGKKGSVINLPNPARGAANAKAEHSVVTLNATSGSDIAVTIDKHYEYSFTVEDIVETQALSSLRAFYTDDAGEALAVAVDTSLHALGATWNAGTTYGAAYVGGDGTTSWTAGAETALTDAAIRTTIQRLDDANAPGRDRSLVIPPITKKTLLGIARFTEQAFTGESGSANSIRNGLVGNIYGIDVFVSSNCATSTNARACLLFHKGVAVLATQQAVRTQAQYKQELLGTLVTADTIWGVKNLRVTTLVGSGYALMVPK